MIDAIVYYSKSGHTKKYANFLAEKISIPVLSLKESKKLPKGSSIIYMSWIRENKLVKYEKVMKYNLLFCIGVGLREESKEIISLIKEETVIKEELFYLRGGINKKKLGIMDSISLKMINNELSYKALDKTASYEELDMLEAILYNKSFVNTDDLNKIIEYIKKTNLI